MVSSRPCLWCCEGLWGSGQSQKSNCRRRIQPHDTRDPLHNKQTEAWKKKTLQGSQVLEHSEMGRGGSQGREELGSNSQQLQKIDTSDRAI